MATKKKATKKKASKKTATKKKAVKKAKATPKKYSGGAWGKAQRSGAKSVHVKASTWGMARETFKRTQRKRVFRTAKKCKEHSGCYVVFYADRTKQTAMPKGSATDAVKKMFGEPKKKTAKKKAVKKKATKKPATKKKATKKKATKKKSGGAKASSKSGTSYEDELRKTYNKLSAKKLRRALEHESLSTRGSKEQLVERYLKATYKK